MWGIGVVVVGRCYGTRQVALRLEGPPSNNKEIQYDGHG